MMMALNDNFKQEQKQGQIDVCEGDEMR